MPAPRVGTSCSRSAVTHLTGFRLIDVPYLARDRAKKEDCLLRPTVNDLARRS